MPLLQSPAKVQEKRQKRSQAMLDIRFENNYVFHSPEKISIICDVCKDEAFIFQDEGNFCLECWQRRTEPDITVRQ